MTRENPNLQRRDLIIELIALTQELERPPSEEELDEFGEYRYHHYEEEFGDLYNALDESGILPESVTRDKFSQSQLSDKEPTATISSGENTEDTVESTDETTERAPTGDKSVNGDHPSQTAKEDEPVDTEPIAGETASVQKRSSPPSSEFADLTSFQRDILIVLVGADQYKGLEIKEELESYYDKEIHHGRLYPNLDTLVEEELVEKIALDERSNGYSLSDQGEAHVTARRHWESELLDWLPEPSEEMPSIGCGNTTSPATGQLNQSTNKGDPEVSTSASDTAVEKQDTAEEADPSDGSDDLLNEIMNEFEGLDETLSDSE